MARRKREDYLKEKEAQARADLVRSGRDGRDYLMHNVLRRPLGEFAARRRKVLHDLETERLAHEAAENEDYVAQRGPVKLPNLRYPLLFLCLLILTYLILAELGVV